MIYFNFENNSNSLFVDSKDLMVMSEIKVLKEDKSLEFKNQEIVLETIQVNKNILSKLEHVKKINLYLLEDMRYKNLGIIDINTY